ncbi:MAG: hypothetical protein ACQKBY_13515, partial [Verrucomicrobiales bacterium]
MKRLILLGLLPLLSPLSAQDAVSLSEVDRQLLLEKLKEVQESARQTTLDRFDNALQAFKSAASSEAATHDLYLKCVEKVNFDDQNKKTQEFREWKRRH